MDDLKLPQASPLFEKKIGSHFRHYDAAGGKFFRRIGQNPQTGPFATPLYFRENPCDSLAGVVNCWPATTYREGYSRHAQL